MNVPIESMIVLLISASIGTVFLEELIAILGKKDIPELPILLKIVLRIPELIFYLSVGILMIDRFVVRLNFYFALS